MEGRGGTMTAEQLARMLDTWSDALNVAELVENPLLRVGKRWDLHDWQVEDVAEGIRLRRLSPAAAVLGEVLVVSAPQKQGRIGPARVNAAVPTSMILVGPEQCPAREDVQPVI